MTDWVRVFAYEKHTYVQDFPVTSFLLAGVSSYKDTIQNVKIDDILDMTFEPTNRYDSTAIVIKKENHICGYVPRDTKCKITPYTPSKVIVIDKRLVKDNIYSLRVDIMK